MTSCPRSVRTSSIHRVVCWNDDRSAVSTHTHDRTRNVIHDHGHGRVADVARDQAAEALLSRRVPQLQAHLRSATAAHLTVRSSRYIVFERKSMPIVACGSAETRTVDLICVVEAVVHKACNQGRLPHCPSENAAPRAVPDCSPRKTSLNLRSGLEKSVWLMLLCEKSNGLLIEAN